MCWQVSSRLASGAEALKTSGDLRSISLRQSISGALQRVSGIRSPGASGPAPGESLAEPDLAHSSLVGFLFEMTLVPGIQLDTPSFLCSTKAHHTLLIRLYKLSSLECHPVPSSKFIQFIT